MEVIITSPIARPINELIDTLNQTNMQASLSTSMFRPDKVKVERDGIELFIVPSPGNRVFSAKVFAPLSWKIPIIIGCAILGLILSLLLLGSAGIIGLAGNYMADKLYEENKKSFLDQLVRDIKLLLASEKLPTPDVSKHLIG